MKFRLATSSESQAIDRQSRGRPSAWPFLGMSPGDAVVIENPAFFSRARFAAHYAGSVLGGKFACKKTDEGTYLIKRIS